MGEFEQVLALSVLCQAVLGLAERQAELLERIEALETLLGASETRQDTS